MFFNRNFTTRVSQPLATLVVEELRWSAMGGPKLGTVSASSDDAAEIWSLIDLLRCPVEVWDDATPIWWGFVSAANVIAGMAKVGVSIDSMSNRIQVTYSNVTAAGTVGERASTAWSEDALSIADYGTKEGRKTISQATASQAAAAVATLLAKLSYPTPTVEIQAQPAARPTAELELSGWWSSLGWEFYANSSGRAANEVSGDADQFIGSLSTNQRAAQSFAIAGAGWSAQTVKARVRRVGSPADNLTLAIHADNAGEPGTLLASATIAMSSISTTSGWVDGTLNSRVAITPGVVYWLVVARSGSYDASNYAVVSVDTAVGFPDGTLLIYNGSSWGARSPIADLCFVVGGVVETSTQLQTIISEGQFVSSVSLDVASGVYSCPYQDGDYSALDVVAELARAGTATGTRILATVTRDRAVRIYEQPAKTANSGVFVKPDGSFTDLMDNELPTIVPAGVWGRLKDALPAGMRVGGQADPTVFFIEDVVYNARSGRIHVREERISRDEL
jgi:hypothetical protein